MSLLTNDPPTLFTKWVLLCDLFFLELFNCCVFRYTVHSKAPYCPPPDPGDRVVLFVMRPSPKAIPTAKTQLARRVKTTSGAWTFSGGASWNETGSCSGPAPTPGRPPTGQAGTGPRASGRGEPGHKSFTKIRHHCFRFLKRVTSSRPQLSPKHPT